MREEGFYWVSLHDYEQGLMIMEWLLGRWWATGNEVAFEDFEVEVGSARLEPPQVEEVRWNQG